MIMKRYLLFLYYGTDIEGGWNDFYGSYDAIEEAKTAFAEYVGDSIYHYGHIIDTTLDPNKAMILYNDGHEEWEVCSSDAS